MKVVQEHICPESLMTLQEHRWPEGSRWTNYLIVVQDHSGPKGSRGNNRLCTETVLLLVSTLSNTGQVKIKIKSLPMHFYST